MWELSKSFYFEAGHVLPGHAGKCSRPHGHSYTLTVILFSKSLQNEGPEKMMVMEFEAISHIVKPLIDQYLDHHLLNETLQTDYPTVEFISQWIYRKLKPQIPLLQSIKLQETRSSAVSYRED